MKAVLVRYLNEIISLTVLALMAVALIAGQAEATNHDDVRSVSGLAATTIVVSLDEALGLIVLQADKAIKLGLDEIVKRDEHDNSTSFRHKGE